MDRRSIDGARAERRAARTLSRAGLKVLARNYRCRLGELDLVATDGDTLVFVEVRSRRSADFGAAELSVGAAKQRQIARVARHFLTERRPRFVACRFDVIGITAGELRWIRDAFRPGWP